MGKLIWGTVGNAVDALFIISGFVVFLPTVARHGEFGNVGAYALRRAARLVPAYWAILGLILLLIVIVPLHPPIPFPAGSSIALHLGYLQAPAELFQNDFQVGFGIDGPLWTLSLEVTFYVILPFVAAAYFRRPLVGLLAAAAIAVAWNEGFSHLTTLGSIVGLHPSPSTTLHLRLAADSQFPFWAFSFGLGMTGAWAYVRLHELHPPGVLARRVLWVQAASLASLALFVYLAGRYAATVPPPLVAEVARQSPLIALGYSGSLATFMVATALGPTMLQKPFAHPFARWLGDISYGIFLIHLVVVTYAVRLLSLPTDGTVGALAQWSAVVLPLSVLYGYASARLLEQPIRRWAHRFGRRSQARDAGAPARA